MALERRLAILNKLCIFHPLFITDLNKVEDRLKEKTAALAFVIKLLIAKQIRIYVNIYVFVFILQFKWITNYLIYIL